MGLQLAVVLALMVNTIVVQKLAFNVQLIVQHVHQIHLIVDHAVPLVV